MYRFVVLLAVALASVPAFLSPAAAQTGIRLVVNGTPITGYDIDQRVKLSGLTGKPIAAKAAEEELINEAVQMAEAKKRGINIPDAQVEKGFANIAQNVKLSPDQLVQALSQRGIAAATLKNRLRVQMAWQNLMQARMAQAIKIKNEDVEQALKTDKPAVATINEYLLRQIVFVVPKGSPAGYAAQRKAQADAFRAKLTSCDQAFELAKAVRDVSVLDLMRRNSQQMAGPLGDAVKETPVGHATKPFPSERGVELIAVCSKKDIQGTATARNEAETKLAMSKAEQVSKDYVKELRDKAVIERR